jgi:predicted HTH transcriptional regulator
MEVEHNRIEYKSDIDGKEAGKDFKAEVVSFLNSRTGGTILLGANDDGTEVQFASASEKRKKYQEWEEQLANWITNAFEPEVIGLIHVNPAVTPMDIKVSGGLNRPYYYKDGEGFNPKGVYIKVGSTKRRASAEQIKRLLISGVAHLWEQQQSEFAKLDFGYVHGVLAKLGIEFSEPGLEIRKPGESYNNLGLLLSDQNPSVTKVAVFEGTKVDTFLDKKEYAGSAAEQIDKTLEYMRLVIRERNVITGAPQRTVLPDYPSKAVRESVLNMYGHRDWTMRSDIRIFVFDDRIEFYSPGGAPDNLTIKQIINGASVKRNPLLIKVLDKLDYIENYNSGIQRILEEYEGFPKTPEFFTDDALFKVTLYNKNYYYDNLGTDTYSSGDTTQNATVSATVNETQAKVLEFMLRDRRVTMTELASFIGKHRVTIATNIRKLKEAGLVERVGSDKDGYWRVIQ